MYNTVKIYKKIANSHYNYNFPIFILFVMSDDLCSTNVVPRLSVNDGVRRSSHTPKCTEKYLEYQHQQSLSKICKWVQYDEEIPQRVLSTVWRP